MTREIRRQRQRATIERAAAAGDLARASALLAEHVIEFPEDEELLDRAAPHPLLDMEGTA